MTTSRLIIGDCLDVMPTLPAESVHAIVTDPPYGLEFMGKEWDKLGATTETVTEGTDKTHPFRDGTRRVRYGKDAATMQAWHHRWATEALRVAKPGAFLLAFGGTRTFHRLTCALEDAGWEIRDCVMWLYGSGFPKSLDVSKAIDKASGVEREVVGFKKNVGHIERADGNIETQQCSYNDTAFTAAGGKQVFTAPATDAAKQWDGWGTALKPAWEPIIVARKPLDGTVANNVLKHGCGGLNVDGCRVDACAESFKDGRTDKVQQNAYGKYGVADYDGSKGRWPANVVHDGSDEVVGEFPAPHSAGHARIGSETPRDVECAATSWSLPKNTGDQFRLGDSGSAARFFYCAKASRSERNAGCGGLPVSQTVGGGGMNNTPDDVCGKYGSIKAPARNHHPTVKPLALMNWLVTLVAPLGGTVLDPFMGSGTTGIACGMLGFDFIGIDKDPQYVEIAKARVREHCGLLVELAGE